MRMVVVLPLPLGPRKPQISPARTWSVEVVDDVLAAEALGQAADVDGEVGGHGAARCVGSAHVDRLARDAAAGCVGRGRASTMNTSFARLSRL